MDEDPGSERDAPRAPRRRGATRRAQLASVHELQPPFWVAVVADAHWAMVWRGQGPLGTTRRDHLRGVLYLAWASDAFLGQMAYRAKARMQALGIPVLPRVAHGIAMATAQICIGDPVVMEPGVYIAHGQVVADGSVRISSGTVLYPWVTLGLRGRGRGGPRIGRQVQIGSGSKVLGPVTIGANARVGANSVVLDDVAARTTVVGAPARPVSHDVDLD